MIDAWKNLVHRGATGGGAPQPRRGDGAQKKEAGAGQRRATLTVPIIAPELRVHRIHVPAPTVPRVSGEDVARAGRSVAEHLPPPQQCAYYAGLGLLAAFEVIEWPVAAAIGVGTAIARRTGIVKAAPPEAAQGREEPAPQGREEPAAQSREKPAAQSREKPAAQSREKPAAQSRPKQTAQSRQKAAGKTAAKPKKETATQATKPS
ncbi:hypothetical protein [Marinactinospora rubrisoli]|uniref:Uncharacterized protein n=1 Tax=Marinactinospora rubrisoli TaxID=2715399 RepID=A0ABW2KIC7_9ACTN